jgi:hypothetical protein
MTFINHIINHHLTILIPIGISRRFTETAPGGLEHLPLKLPREVAGPEDVQNARRPVLAATVRERCRGEQQAGLGWTGK